MGGGGGGWGQKEGKWWPSDKQKGRQKGRGIYRRRWDEKDGIAGWGI